MSASAAQFDAPLLESLPSWVPEGAQHYIAHTEGGEPIRALARAAGCHASTILRQIRKIELRRDDPLIDSALQQLSNLSGFREQSHGDTAEHSTTILPSDEAFDREAMRVLRRLCEPGAVLAVAPELAKAVVVRDAQGGNSTRTAIVSTQIAQAMALNNWIVSSAKGRIARYHVTPGGRAALADLLANYGDAVAERAEGQEVSQSSGHGVAEDTSPRPRYSLGETPLMALSRRRNPDGSPFLDDALVNAGERLREDFELAQMEGQVTQNWDHFLTPGASSGRQGSGPMGHGPAAARARVGAAFSDLGPGLSDIVLRCCCYLEGLETAEKRLGWSARSAKIVLRIALIRLQKHYDETVGPGGPLIG